jgi:hypothetical protein
LCVWLMRPPGFASTLGPSPSRHCLKFSWQARDTKCQFCPEPRANLCVYGALIGAFLTLELPSESMLPANLCVYGSLKQAAEGQRDCKGQVTCTVYSVLSVYVTNQQLALASQTGYTHYRYVPHIVLRFSGRWLHNVVLSVAYHLL